VKLGAISSSGHLQLRSQVTSADGFFGCRPHLNFISGENGSGKSAVLQCLQVCLGAQARLTGRAKTARELIMTKQSVAVAKVVLWNTVWSVLPHMLYSSLLMCLITLCTFLGSHPCNTALMGVA
jgi:hypothetical protein